MKASALFLLGLGVFSTFTSSAQATAAKTAPPTKVTTVEGITEYRLSNGLRVLIFPDASKPSTTVNMTYLVGSRMEGYGETGMAHLLEHMVFKGSPGHKDIPHELTEHGASPNGSTNTDRTNYFETFNATDYNLKWALSMEADRMVNSFIAQKDLQSEFSVVRNEFERNENDPEGMLYQRIISAAYMWHNYGKSTIGSKEDIERVPIDNLKAFYKKYYQPDNAVLTIAGKVEEAKAIALVNQYFGGIPKPTRVLQAPYTVEPTQEGERYVELRRVGDIQAVACAYHIPSGTDSDYASLVILTDILAGEPSGRLYKALVDSKKASSQYGFVRAQRDPGTVFFSATVLKDKPLSEAREAMMAVLDSLAYQPVSQADVDRSKAKYQKYIDDLWNNSDRVGLRLSEYIAQGDWRTFFLYRDRLAQVTVDDVNRVAKAYFKKSNRTYGQFFPEAHPDRATVPATGDVDAMVKGYKGRAALADGEQFDASPTNIDKRTRTGKIDGGAQYALLSKKTRGGTVTAQITLRLGTEAALRGTDASADLSAAMLDRGTKDKTREQVKDALDKLKASLNIYRYGQIVSISLSTTHENLDGALKLLTEVLRQPVFPQAEFDKLKDENLANLEQARNEPQALASNVLDRYMEPYPQGHVFSTPSFDDAIADLKKTTLSDVKTFYSNFYNGDNATIAVVGDFNEDTVLTDIRSMLGSWHAPQPYEYIARQYFDVPAKSDKIKTPDKKNARLSVRQNIRLREDDPDYAAVSMANFMIGGGFISSRLATRIRQKEGLSYGVGSWVSAGKKESVGSFNSYAIYNPANSEKLMAAYKEEIQRLLKDGITADELRDARSGFLQQRELGRTRDQQLASKLSENLFLTRTMAWDASFDQAIKALTVEQINAAIRKYIHPQQMSFIEAGDFK